MEEFGTFCVHLVQCFGFGIMHNEKSGNPGHDGRRKSFDAQSGPELAEAHS
jgi:hypothetical protein